MAKKQTKIQLWERIILREIFGRKQIEESWERKSNSETYEVSSDPAIDEETKPYAIGVNANFRKLWYFDYFSFSFQQPDIPENHQ